MTLQESLEQFWAELVARVPHLAAGVLVFGLTVLVASRAAAAVERLLGRAHDRQAIAPLVQRAVRWAILLAGGLVALTVARINVTGLIAGLGITGIVLGLALQDIARNFVAGVILLLRRPYRIGDAVSIAGIEGTVTDMNTRDTTIRRWDGEPAIVPNSTIYTGIIINYTQAPLRQRTIRLQVDRAQDLARTMEIMRQAAAETAGVVETPAPTVTAEGLDGQGMVLALRFWVDTRQAGLLEAHSQVALAVNAALAREGIAPPVPVRQVRLAPGADAGSPHT